MSDDRETIRRELEARPTEELVSILRNRDENEWRPVVFDIVAAILAARGLSPTEVVAQGPEGEDVLEGQQLVTVGSYSSAAAAHVHRMALEEAGLQAWVRDETVGGWYGVGIGSKLQVRVEDETAARAVLEVEADPASAIPPELAEPMEARAPTPEKAERTALVRPSAMRAIEIGAVLLATVAGPIAYAVFLHPTLQRSISQMTLQLPRDIGMSTLLFILLADHRWQSLRGKVWAGTWSRQIALAVILVASGEALAFTVSIFGAGVTSASPSGNGTFASPAAFALYPAAALASALYQESLFRAYILTRLAPWAGDFGAVILSAVCFAAVHGYPARDTGILFVVGLLYGAAYVELRCLPALVAAHWIHNMIWWARLPYP